MAKIAKTYPLSLAAMAQLVETAFRNLGIQLDSQQPHTLVVSGATSISPFSMGERVSVTLNTVEGGTQVVIESHPLTFTNVFGLPRTEANVSAVLRELDKLVEGARRQSTPQS